MTAARARDGGCQSPGTVLEHTLSTPFGVGTNLKGQVAGAAWTFLLPTLELETVVCLGAPTAAALRTLSRLSRRVLVVAPRAQHRRLEQRVAPHPTAELVDSADARLQDLPVDLAVVAGDSPRGTAHQQVLQNATTVFVDGPMPELEGDRDAFGVWLAPGSGEIRKAAAVEDPRSVDFLKGAEDGGAHGPARLRRLAKGLLRRERGGDRVGALIGPRAGAPAYVKALASDAGVDLGGCRVALSAPSEYASRKAILFVFDNDAPAPSWVVKMTREPHLNRRLENEWDALAALRDAGIGDAETLPRPAFHGRHAGLAVVGETAVSGDPLRSRTDGTASCPVARNALKWLLEMGERSAEVAEPSAAVAAALSDLRDRFVDIYDLTPSQHTTLDGHLERIATADALPQVFQHGDPGTWNVLVTGDGRPVFLDWEAFERRGIPLWDAFYFARSHAVTVARAAGTRDALDAVRQSWLQDAPPVRELTGHIDEHCARIGLARDLVEPLFATCWMHRALKEAARLTPGRLQRGHYASLLRLSLDHRDVPGLRRLFETS